MPYTLSSLGHYVTQHRARRAFTVSTALVTPSTFANIREVDRWTTSLHDTHPQFHREGKRAVALITDVSLLAVVPFPWVQRLPLRKPPTLRPEPESAATLFTPVPPETPPHPPKQGRSSRLFVPSPQSVTALYEQERDKLAWWEETYSSTISTLPVDQYEHRLDAQSDLVCVTSAYDAQPCLLRKLDTHAFAHPWADQHGREFYHPTTPLWIPEDTFQVFATSKREFDLRYVILSMSSAPHVSVIHRTSRLVVGVIAAYSDEGVQERLN